MAATRYEQNHAYGTGARHQLTAYYYKKTTKQPALVLIHGGYWYEGDKSSTTFTIDPNRIVALGSSAGGHLATTVGTYGNGKSYLKAIAALSPVANPYRAYYDGQATGATTQKRKLRDTAILLGRCTPYKSDTTCWNSWVDMVTYQRASTTDTPMYLVHSQSDFVPPTHATELCSKLKAKNVSCTAVTISGSNRHGTALLGLTSVRTGVLKWLQARD